MGSVGTDGVTSELCFKRGPGLNAQTREEKENGAVLKSLRDDSDITAAR